MTSKLKSACLNHMICS